MTQQHLFLYGTLQPGESNAKVVEPIPGHWQRATMRGRLLPAGWGSGAGFPGLVPDASGEQVSGWLLSSTVLDRYWKELDAFEGDEYERVRAEATLDNGDVVEVHVYRAVEG